MSCPKCSSPSIQKSNSIYDGGTASAYGSASGGVHYVSSESHSSTGLARRNAPPRWPDVFRAAFLAAIAIWICHAAEAEAWIPIAISHVTMAWIAWSLLRALTVLPVRHERGLRTWFCHSCGHKFLRGRRAIVFLQPSYWFQSALSVAFVALLACGWIAYNAQHSADGRAWFERLSAEAAERAGAAGKGLQVVVEDAVEKTK